MNDYESNRENVIQEILGVENMKINLTQNLIHLQSSWVIEKFQNDEELKNANEPLYYAAQLLNGDIKDLNYEVPEPMVEVVKQILDYVKERRTVYYPNI